MKMFEHTTQTGTSINLTKSALSDGDLALAVQAGHTTLRVELTEDTAYALADALTWWYANQWGQQPSTDNQVATDITKE